MEGTPGTDAESVASPLLLDPDTEEPMPESAEREYLWFDLGDRAGRGDNLSFDSGVFKTRMVQLAVTVGSSGGLTSICIGWFAAGRFVRQRRGAVGNLLPAGLGNGNRDLFMAVAIMRDK